MSPFHHLSRPALIGLAAALETGRLIPFWILDARILDFEGHLVVS